MKKKIKTAIQKFARKGGEARWKDIDDKKRSKMMTELAKKSVLSRKRKAKKFSTGKIQNELAR